MIPTDTQIQALWEKYNLPEYKRHHVSLVARVALYLAKKCQKVDPTIHVDEPLLYAAALLHDIDKAIPRRSGESHPDTGVRVLCDENMREVADIVKTHSLHAILDPSVVPKTWEQKLLYLADKMVKSEIITVDERFKLWNAESLPVEATNMLNVCYPEVKKMEKEIFQKIGIDPSDVANLA